MENTETLIVEQLKIGNENAYRYIYDHHYALLCYVANGYLKDQFLSETIVGDTIFHLWEIRETLDISVSIRSYLLRAVRNRCINYLNSEREKREIAFSALMPDEITDDKIILSDSHPLGILRNVNLKTKYIRLSINCRTNAVGFLLKVALKENHTKKFPVNWEYLLIQLSII